MEQWTKDQRVAFGKRLAEARKGAGMTQVDVGALFEATKQTVSHWEKGRNQMTVEQLQILAREFRVSPEWLLLGDEAVSWPLGKDVTQAEVAALPVDLRIQAIGMLRVLITQAAERSKQQEHAA